MCRNSRLLIACTLFYTFFQIIPASSQSSHDERLYWLWVTDINLPVPNHPSIDSLHWIDIQRIESTNQYLILEGHLNSNRLDTECTVIASGVSNRCVNDENCRLSNDLQQVNFEINRINEYFYAFEQKKLGGVYLELIPSVSIPTGCVTLPPPPGTTQPEVISAGFGFETALDMNTLVDFYTDYVSTLPGNWQQLSVTGSEARWQNSSQCTVHVQYFQREAGGLAVFVTSAIEPIVIHQIVNSTGNAPLILNGKGDDEVPGSLSEVWQQTLLMFPESTGWKQGFPTIPPDQQGNLTAFLTMVSPGDTYYVLFREIREGDSPRTWVQFEERRTCSLVP